MESARARPESDDSLGRRIRAERASQKITLRKLAATIKISPSALSQIETGQSRPSVRTLYAIVTELGISLDALFGDARVSELQSPEQTQASNGSLETPVQRADSRKVIVMESGARWERLNPIGDKGFDFLEVEYQVGGASSQGDTFMRHHGREYGLVLQGRLKVTVGFDEFELDAGDSICFDSSTPHRLETLGNKAVRAVWVVIGRDGSDARAAWGGQLDPVDGSRPVPRQRRADSP